jgi:hypothetical protein
MENNKHCLMKKLSWVGYAIGGVGVGYFLWGSSSAFCSIRTLFAAAFVPTNASFRWTWAWKSPRPQP